jgi:hypothetical protein
MLLAPKIDEIAYTIKTVDADIALFTETWLRDTVPDISINIKHYQLYRRDRVNRLHGGVCMYVKDSIRFSKILADLNHSHHEVLWAKSSTKTLTTWYLKYHSSCSISTSSRGRRHYEGLPYIVLGDLKI